METISDLQFEADKRLRSFPEQLSKYLQFYANNLILRENINIEKKKDIFEIPFEELKKDYDLVLFDYDDTLAGYYNEPSEEVIVYLKSLQVLGYKLAIVSNKNLEDLEKLAETFKPLDIFVVQRNDKPNPYGYQVAMDKYNISPDKTIMVGDRVGMDLYGAYNAGISKLFLVDPYSEIHGGDKGYLLDRAYKKLENALYLRTRHKNL